MKVKNMLRHAIELCQMPLCKTEEFDTINKLPTTSKFVATMMDPVVLVKADIDQTTPVASAWSGALKLYKLLSSDVAQRIYEMNKKRKQYSREIYWAVKLFHSESYGFGLTDINVEVRHHVLRQVRDRDCN